MDAVNQLLDQARVGTNLPSDNALAQRMGVTRAVVSNWRQARNPIPDERIAQLCAMAKLDGPAWTARIHAERAASPAERAMWKSMLDRLSAVAAVLALVVFAAPGAARAKAIDSQGFSGSDQAHSVYYVHLRLDRTGGLAPIHFSFASPQDLSVKPLRRTTFSAISYRRYQSEPSSPAAGHDKPATR